MRSLVVQALLLASSSITTADTVICNVSDGLCSNADLTLAPTMTIQFGTDTLRFAAPVPTGQGFDSNPASIIGIFANGGGFVLLQDASGNVLADGTFLPGLFSEIHGSGFYDFTGNVNFFYLDSAIYGSSTGTGDVSVEYDPTINFASPDMPAHHSFR